MAERLLVEAGELDFDPFDLGETPGFGFDKIARFLDDGVRLRRRTRRRKARQQFGM